MRTFFGRSILLPVLTLGVVLLSGCATKAQMQPGFTEAYLSRATLELLRGGGSVGIRVYNAKRSASDNAGTVVAIGVLALRGAENTSTGAKPYRLFDRLGTTTTVEQQLNRTAAQTAVRYIDNSTNLRFCTELTNAQVNALLSDPSCNAVKVEPVPAGANLFSMRFTPVRIAGGVATPITGSTPISPTDPCPATCGPLNLYLW